MCVSLQEGLYSLCEARMARDAEYPGPRPRPLDDAAFDAYRLWQLRRTVRRVREMSPFYRRLLGGAGVTEEQLTSLADIAKLPFTRPEDLAGAGYGLMCCSQGEVEKPVTFYSSGSTGMKKRIFFSAADIQKILEFLPRGMNTVAGRDEARVLVLLPNTQGRGIGGLLARSLEDFGMRAWTADLRESAKELLRVSVEHGVNVWFGDAVTIFRASRILERRADLRALGMKCIFATMSNIPGSMAEYLGRAWGCRVSTHYGLTESGWGLAVDCGRCPGYHYDELDHILEIVDPETGAPLPDGQEGEVVLTNIARDCMPLIRYRTGDIAAMTPSVCGSHLRCLGHIRRRKEGAAEYRGRSVWPALFDETLFAAEGLLDYRIFLEGGRLGFELEVLEPACFDAEGLKSRLMSLPCMVGAPEIGLKLLPCGALREFCYEKKRIVERGAP